VKCDRRTLTYYVVEWMEKSPSAVSRCDIIPTCACVRRRARRIHVTFQPWFHLFHASFTTCEVVTRIAVSSRHQELETDFCRFPVVLTEVPIVIIIIIIIIIII
jgi:hypothetical protein